MIVNRLFQGYTLNSYLFNMACESHMEGLQNFAKQLEEQKATITAQIQSLDAIFNDVKDEDLKWVTEKIHYYLLRLLEDADYEI